MKTYFQDTHPYLVDEWNFNKNSVPLNKVTTSSPNLHWWICNRGHEWKARVADRTRARSTSCPFCANKKVLTGFNDLATMNPSLAAEFHPVKNYPLTPEITLPGSSGKVWWVCDKGHEWEARIASRNQGANCKWCSGNTILAGFNDLKTTNPTLAGEFHPHKNHPLTVEQVGLNTNKKVWWLGTCGHEWEAAISSRNAGKNCSICSNKTVLVGETDLLTKRPDLFAELHPIKNKNTDFQTIHFRSTKLFWWLCDRGHEWKTTVSHRTIRQQGCPSCSSKVSKAEQDISDFLSELQVSHIQRYQLPHENKKVELDLYVPEQSIAIEFNGLYWHSEAQGKTKFYHYNKWKVCKDKGIRLVQIWEDDWNRNPDLIKRMIVNKLNRSVGRKTYARKTHVAEITQRETSDFLDQYHIQNSTDGGIRLGLFSFDFKENKQVLVAVMVLKKEPGTEGRTFNLLRFATSTPVVGGFTKLLNYVRKTYSPDSIVTFSDNSVSDGGLYENNGFVAVRELKPDYMYVVKGKRVHKFNYRLKRFKNDDALKYDFSLTERQLALLNNIPRIWDAGKTKWEIKYVI